MVEYKGIQGGNGVQFDEPPYKSGDKGSVFPRKHKTSVIELSLEDKEPDRFESIRSLLVWLSRQ